jgi:membrane fusion protein (multidrug efflux system)
MPDGPKKKQNSEPDSQVTKNLPKINFTTSSSWRRNSKFALISFVIIVAIFFGGREVHLRSNYVFVEDSRVEADMITVSSRVAGWVTALDITEGSKVLKDQVLLNIDSRVSHLRISELNAKIAGIDAEHDKLIAERRMIDKKTESMFTSEKSNRDAAQITLSSLTPQLKLAKRELERTKSLFKRKVVSRRQLDQGENAHSQINREQQIALAGLRAADAKLAEAGAERTQLAVLDGDLNILKYRKAEFLLQLEKQNLDLNDHTIRSPVGGVIDKTFVRIGEYITPGQRLALAHNPRKVWVEANIKETQIRLLKLGQQVEVKVDAYPEIRFHGRVISVGNATTSEFTLLPSPNPSGNFTKITQRLPVRIAIKQKENLLRPGMMVEVNIDIRNP